MNPVYIVYTNSPKDYGRPLFIHSKYLIAKEYADKFGGYRDVRYYPDWSQGEIPEWHQTEKVE